MPLPLKILLLEDYAADAELALRELERDGVDCTMRRVETEEAFVRMLDEFHPDVILSDFTLPAFDGLTALEIARKVEPDIPFIFVSGTLGEERAIESLKRGAVDYVLKTNLRRLAPAVRRALQECVERKERRKAEQRVARLSRIHAVLSGINSTIVRVRQREELFRDACRIAVVHGGFRFAWIGLVDPETLDIRPAAWMGQDDGYLAGLKLSASGAVSEEQDAAGLAVRSRSAVVINDVATDSRLRDAGRALDRGFRALVVLPLVIDEKAAGVLGLYADEPDIFDEEELKLLGELAANIAFALDHIAKTERADYLAYYDGLTGLANRTLFSDRVAQYLHAAARGESVAILMIDLERFRHINETFGVAAGDAVLRTFAKRLAQAVPEHGTVARINADRFGVAVAGIRSVSDVARLLEQELTTALAQPFEASSQQVHIPGRAGVAVSPGDGSDAATLCTNAETALQDAKRRSEIFMFYAPEMNARVAERLTLENRLRVALKEGEFTLHYQPKIDLATGAISGLEALLRWNSPDLGMVLPERFISILEDTGMIVEVGLWAVRRAIADQLAWRKRGLAPPRTAVNVSTVQLRHARFVNEVSDLVEAGGAAGRHIDLEITESMIMADIASSMEKLSAIRALGVGLSLDDFGTGYSSLSYIARLPVITIKIDRSFIAAMRESAEQLAIVSAVISLARALRLRVVAEGVETSEQARLLKELGCDEAQGFHYSRALPAQEVAALFARKT
ncbi:MAG TPA: EAL domain-containing protein [Burkholderiales bacterium]|nr:EAL domain-containing protein [Burkholderiales bacterium]